jgi:hypothetical protein
VVNNVGEKREISLEEIRKIIAKWKFLIL